MIKDRVDHLVVDMGGDTVKLSVYCKRFFTSRQQIASGELLNRSGDNMDISLIYPNYENDKPKYNKLSPTAFHDLGLDVLVDELTDQPRERRIITDYLSSVTADRRVCEYRQKVFVDILAMPELRTKMLALFEKISELLDRSTIRKGSNEKLGLWYLLHRLGELRDYINCVETMRECLADDRICSDGLKQLRLFIEDLYEDRCFSEMKDDIAAMSVKAADIRSVTVGINLNDRLEAMSLGLVSINSKPFKRSGIFDTFANALSSKDRISDTTEWDEDYRYEYVERSTGDPLNIFDRTAKIMPIRPSTIVNIPDGDGSRTSTFYFETVMNKMLDHLVKKLSDTLMKYTNVAIVNISALIPEFMYYIRFAEYVEKQIGAGCPFCEAQITDKEMMMDARGVYNLKLILGRIGRDEIVYNDLHFDKDSAVCILTGANRGGKTTITQAVGQLFALAQGGIFVPASSFDYNPVDCIYTHFPADEDKTLDLGRLGEECVRFREMYSEATGKSLMLLNETFSTTSFEEGYYIARDAVRALLKKGVRTIYNTHMHKLAEDTVSPQNDEGGYGAVSMIVKSDGGDRSFKVEYAPPEGMSYASDIALKYGVTYEMLTRTGK